MSLDLVFDWDPPGFNLTPELYGVPKPRGVEAVSHESFCSKTRICCMGQRLFANKSMTNILIC